jgi:hypothetical protein
MSWTFEFFELFSSVALATVTDFSSRLTLTSFLLQARLRCSLFAIAKSDTHVEVLQPHTRHWCWSPHVQDQGQALSTPVLAALSATVENTCMNCNI